MENNKTKVEQRTEIRSKRQKRKNAVQRLTEFFNHNMDRWVSKQEIYETCYPLHFSEEPNPDFFMNRSIDVSLSTVRKNFKTIKDSQDDANSYKFELQRRSVDKKSNYKLVNIRDFHINDNYQADDIVYHKRLGVIKFNVNVVYVSSDIRYATQKEITQYNKSHK